MTQRIIKAVRGNLIAWLALFVALGGTSLAASHFVITSTKQIKPSVIKKLKGNRGAAGPKGATGATGAQGAAGTVDTSNFFNKTESDGRYLGKTAQAADSAKLGGFSASSYTTGEGSQGGNFVAPGEGQEDVNFLNVPGLGQVTVKCVTPTVNGAVGVKFTQHAAGPVFVNWVNYPNKAATRVETEILVNDDDSLEQGFTASENGEGEMVIQVASVSASTHVYGTITVSDGIQNGECRFFGSYTVADQRF
ncbi:MAG TPA: hypothetical protein VGG08_01120 [Solirubrobacteraceae bacterium]